MTRVRIHALVQIVLILLVVALGWHYGTVHVPGLIRADLARFASGHLMLWASKRIHPLARIAACCATFFPAVLWLCGRAASAPLPTA